MKIGIEAQRLFRRNKHGMDFVALELVTWLQRLDHGHEFHILVQPGPDICLEPAANFQIHPLTGGFYPWWEQVTLPRAAQRLGLDLLHCTSNTAPVRTGPPLVLTLHDIIYLEPGGLFSRSKSSYQNLGALYRRLVVPPVVRRSAALITVSEFEKERIAARFPQAAARLHAIHNGISDAFRPDWDAERQAQVRARHRLSGDFLLFLGNTDPKKNLRNLLIGYAGYVRQSGTPVPLVVVDYREELLHQKLAEWGISDIASHLILPGYLKREELALFYAMAALFLYPSRRESFGLPILEAMASGTPVITSTTSSMPEVAGGAALLVDPEQPEEITAAIIRLLDDPGERRRLTQAGLRRAAQFSWKAMAEQVLMVYDEVLRRADTLSNKE